METPLVRGSPYVTMLYNNLTPVISAGAAITGFSGGGDRYQVTLGNGEGFIVYASTPISLSQVGNTIQSNAAFTGSLSVRSPTRS